MLIEKHEAGVCTMFSKTESNHLDRQYHSLWICDLKPWDQDTGSNSELKWKTSLTKRAMKLQLIRYLNLIEPTCRIYFRIVRKCCKGVEDRATAWENKIYMGGRSENWFDFKERCKQEHRRRVFCCCNWREYLQCNLRTCGDSLKQQEWNILQTIWRRHW